MPRTWLAISVELLGGRGETLWPTPRRVFAVGPSHTFTDLAVAIDAAFARWDLSHLRVFTLPDGRTVTDAESPEEFDATPFGALPLESLDIDTVKVARTVKVADEFKYVFDLGDDWTHACAVEDKVDPVEVVGIVPKWPTAFWGWGEIPDQYGRRWADDDGSDAPPKPPRERHPMLDYAWPSGSTPSPPVDLVELRGAIARGDVAGIRKALEGHDIGDVLQLAGTAAQVALRAGRGEGEALATSVMERLRMRGAPGDEELAADLLAALRGEQPEGRLLPVDLEEVAMLLEGDPMSGEGGYVDLRIGEVVPHLLTDEAEVGEDAVDVEEEPGRWLRVPCEGSRAGWEDMRTYAAGLPQSRLSEELLGAIEGQGAFRRFGDIVRRQGLLESWRAFSEDRQRGRARAFLAENGIRAGVATPPQN
jgi:hypothetical protein